MPNDAMLLSVDAIRFTSEKGFQKRFYVVGIAADNFGKFVLSEPLPPPSLSTGLARASRRLGTSPLTAIRCITEPEDCRTSCYFTC